MLPQYPLAGAGNTACEDMGYPSITVVGLKNNPPEKPLGRGRLMEYLALRTVLINQFLITLGSWGVLPGLFLEILKIFFFIFFLFLHPFGSGVFTRGKAVDIWPIKKAWWDIQMHVVPIWDTSVGSSRKFAPSNPDPKTSWLPWEGACLWTR